MPHRVAHLARLRRQPGAAAAHAHGAHPRAACRRSAARLASPRPRRRWHLRLGAEPARAGLLGRAARPPQPAVGHPRGHRHPVGPVCRQAHRRPRLPRPPHALVRGAQAGLLHAGKRRGRGRMGGAQHRPRCAQAGRDGDALALPHGKRSGRLAAPPPQVRPQGHLRACPRAGRQQGHDGGRHPGHARRPAQRCRTGDGTRARMRLRDHAGGGTRGHDPHGRGTRFPPHPARRHGPLYGHRCGAGAGAPPPHAGPARPVVRK